MTDTNIFQLCPFLWLLHCESHCLFTPSLDANANIIVDYVLRVIPKDHNNLFDWGIFGHAGKLALLSLKKIASLIISMVSTLLL